MDDSAGIQFDDFSLTYQGVDRCVGFRFSDPDCLCGILPQPADLQGLQPRDDQIFPTAPPGPALLMSAITTALAPSR